MFKKIILLGLTSLVSCGTAYAIDQTEIMYGQQKLKIDSSGRAQVSIVGSSSTNIGTITAFEQPIWTATPPTKCYEFIVNLPALGTSATLFTIGTPIAGYRAFIDDILIIRDEIRLIDYMSIQLIDMENNRMIGGGEIVPACPIKVTPATPLLVTNCKLFLQNKSTSIQRIKIDIIVSVRKIADPIYGQPY